MKTSDKKTLRVLKDLLWALAFAGLVVGIGRFAFGLGASTNMLDALPWGWWKVFNMVAGAALATSGFVMAAVIYIFQMDRYRPVARLSVVVGFLGYGSSLVALLFDIGLPHRGWHPFFMWNPHSFLFEVFWCVSIYWGVTALELLPIVTERLALKKFTHWLHEKMLPFVVLGITLSTMHHSSLGSLFMMSPTRLHQLWYSLWIPTQFFVSAMGGGLSAIVLLALLAGWLYRHELETTILRRLAVASAVLLAVFLGMRVTELTMHDKWGFVFGADATWESYVFLVELSLQAVLPILLYALPWVRRSRVGLGVTASLALVGLIMHRLDTGIVGYFRTADAVYVPNLSELILSFGVLSTAGLFFFFLVERFHVLDEPAAAHHGGAHGADVEPLTREELRGILTGPGAWRAARVFAVFVPLTWLGLSEQATGAYKPVLQPVDQAVRAQDPMRTKLVLDANKNGMVTAFDHKKHQLELQKLYGLSEQQSCAKCHHLNLPKDNNTSCRRCHADMELATAIFDSGRHRPRFESEAAWEKFLAIDLDNRREAAKACLQCHDKPEQKMVGLAALAPKGFDMHAPGFKHAMHGSCLTCHRLREQELKEDPAKPKSRGNCLFCHRDWADAGLFREEEEKAAAEAARAMLGGAEGG